MFQTAIRPLLYFLFTRLHTSETSNLIGCLILAHCIIPCLEPRLRILTEVKAHINIITLTCQDNCVHIPVFQKSKSNLIFPSFVDHFPQVTTITNTARTIVSSVITPSFRQLISIIQGPDGRHFTTKLEQVPKRR